MFLFIDKCNCIHYPAQFRSTVDFIDIDIKGTTTAFEYSCSVYTPFIRHVPTFHKYIINICLSNEILHPGQ